MIPPCTPTRLGSILEPDVDSRFTLSDETWLNRQTHRARHEARGNGFGYQMFNADSPYCHALTATAPHLFLLSQQRQNPHQLTPREWARMQGFPDSFVLPGTDHQSYRQLGNRVAVPVIEAIARQMMMARRIDDWWFVFESRRRTPAFGDRGSTDRADPLTYL